MIISAISHRKSSGETLLVVASLYRALPVTYPYLSSQLSVSGPQRDLSISLNKMSARVVERYGD